MNRNKLFGDAVMANHYMLVITPTRAEVEMKNSTTVIALLATFLLGGCSFKIGIKERYFTTEELKNYAIDNNYPFDYLLKFKNLAFFKSRRENNINSLNFMNLYSKNNALLKSSDGENCEFKIPSLRQCTFSTMAGAGLQPVPSLRQCTFSTMAGAGLQPVPDNQKLNI